jgi:hypothetical protein
VKGVRRCISRNTADVKLVYDMPTDAVPAILELQDSMFSGGAQVQLAP